jgi:hypothetical protein
MRLAAIVLLLSSFCFAQQTPPAEVPVENEPHHHLVFENEYVRVFKVEVAPHEATLVHRHKRDYVVVTIGDAEVTNAVVGKEPKKWNFKDGDVTFLEATGEKSFAHKAVNERGQTFLNYTIELKQNEVAEKVSCGYKAWPCAEPELIYSSSTFQVRERKGGSSFAYECGQYLRPCLIVSVTDTNTGPDTDISWWSIPKRSYCFERCSPEYYLGKGRKLLGTREFVIRFNLTGVG